MQSILGSTFQTQKYVRIHDKRLGRLYWICVSIAFIWLIVIKLMRNCGYLSFREADGRLRISYERCERSEVCIYKPVKALPYCCRDDCPSGRRRTQRRCKYFDEFESESESTNYKEIFVPSFFIDEVAELNETCFNVLFNESRECGPLWSRVETNKYYLADVESHKIILDHSVEQTEFGLKRKSRDVPGEGRLQVQGDRMVQHRLCEDYGSPAQVPCYVEANETSEKERYDSFLLSTLLRAAGIDLEEHPLSQRSVEGGPQFPSNSTYRIRGISMQLSITWSNWDYWKGVQSMRYSYKVRKLMPGKHFEARHIWKKYPKVRLWRLAHGIDIQFIFDGSLAQFNAFNLILHLTAFITTVSFINWIFTQIARTCIPHYDSSIVEDAVRPCMEDIEALRNMSYDELQALLTTRQLPGGGSVERLRWRLLEDGWRAGFVELPSQSLEMMDFSHLQPEQQRMASTATVCSLVD